MRKIEIPGGKFKTSWSGDAGPAPMLQWLPIADLVVDDGYQRDLKTGNWKSIRKIADSFTWSRFSPVFVAPIEGGKYAIIDGQHRVHAALLCEFETVPCQIVQMSREEQAKSFAAVNGMVTKVTVWNLLKAELASGADWAVQLNCLVEEAGCKLALSNSTAEDKRAGTIYAGTGLRKLLEKHGPKPLLTALKIVRNADGYRDVPEPWTGTIIIPLLTALCQRPRAIARPEFAKRFELYPIWDEQDRIHKETKERLRRGMPSMSKKELLESSLVDWIDKAFPEKVGVAA